MSDQTPLPVPGQGAQPEQGLLAATSDLSRLLSRTRQAQEQKQALEDGIARYQSAYAQLVIPAFAEIGNLREQVTEWVQLHAPRDRRGRMRARSMAQLFDYLVTGLRERFGRDVTRFVEAAPPEEVLDGPDWSEAVDRALTEFVDDPQRVPDAVRDAVQACLEQGTGEFPDALWNWLAEDVQREERPKASSDTPRRPKAEAEVPPDMGKRLFLGLSRALHPDKTRDPELREERTRLMQTVNNAHRQGDMATLLNLVSEHGQNLSPEVLKGLDLEAVQKNLHTQLADLEREIWVLRREGSVSGIEDWDAYVRKPELWKRFLRSVAADLDWEKRSVTLVWSQWQQDDGLRDFLQEFPSSEDWPRFL